MSFWSSLGKGILGSIPVVGPIVGGIIQGAEESKTAKNAANQQVAATNQAIGLLKPYSDTGTKAFNTLGSLMGLGTSGGGGTMPAVQSSLGTTGQVTGPSTNYPSTMGAISDPSVLGGNSAQAPGGGGALMGTPGQVAASQAASSYPSYGPKGSPVPQVTMKAPDGSTNQVPADQVSYWTQKGATVIGNG
jgi:hypothetical protein